LCEIAPGANDLFQPGPEPAEDPLKGLSGDVAEDLLGVGDQGLLCFVRGSVDISPRCTANKKVKHFNFTRAWRPDLCPLGPVKYVKIHCTKGLFHLKNNKFT